MFKTAKVLKKTELCGQQFNVYGTPRDPLFKAQDVADMLGLTNVSDMVIRVDEEERSKLNLGRQGETWFLTESGLYEVLMQSRKPIAKQFKKGVKAILKEIRQTGGYLATTQDDTPELIMARALQVAQVTIENHKQRVQMLEGENEQLLNENKHLAPKAQYTDEVLQSTSTYTMTQVAKEFGYSANTFAQKLRACGIMFLQSGQWMLTSKYQGNGYTNVRTHTFTHSDGRQGTNSITVWTEKGRKFLHDFRKRTSKLQDKKEVTL